MHSRQELFTCSRRHDELNKGKESSMWIYSMYQRPVAGGGHGEFKSQKGDVSGMQQVRRSMVSAQA